MREGVLHRGRGAEEGVGDQLEAGEGGLYEWVRALGEPGKLHHVAFKLDSWERVLRAADLMSMNKISIDIGPTRHGITRGTTIYAFDPSGNRFETFCGGYDTYPDHKAITWTWEEVGPGIFYHDRKLNERFLTVVS